MTATIFAKMHFSIIRLRQRLALFLHSIYIIYFSVLQMESQDKTPIEVLDSILNIVQSLPLDVQHHKKQMILNDKLYNKLYKRKMKSQKKVLKKCKNTKQLFEQDDQLLQYLNNKLSSAQTMYKIVTEMAEQIKEKLVSIGEEGIFDLPDISNVPMVIRTGMRINKNEKDGIYCVCGENSHDDMVCCDAENCKIGWYHFGCVGLCNAPKGSWLCETCKRKKKKGQN